MTHLALELSSFRFDTPLGWRPSPPALTASAGGAWIFPNLLQGQADLIEISPAAVQHDLAALEQAFVLALCGPDGQHE
jgi:hypothetical protein